MILGGSSGTKGRRLNEMSSRVIISIMNTIMNIIIAAEHSDSNAPGTLKKSLDILDAVGKFVFVVYRNVIDIY